MSHASDQALLRPICAALAAAKVLRTLAVGKGGATFGRGTEF